MTYDLSNLAISWGVGASLSEPHTSVTSLHPCLCMFACLLLACLLGPTTYRKSLPALILRGYVIR